MQYDRQELTNLAHELRFVRDTLEKVLRLTEILKYFEADPLLSKCLCLKGGTLANLFILDLPRLSVDIDLDFCLNVDETEMQEKRQEIRTQLRSYLAREDYDISDRSKFYYALDSFVCGYIASNGQRDYIKIEINYMLREHVLNLQAYSISPKWLDFKIGVLGLASLEVYACKIAALLNRSLPRDAYDVSNMLKRNLFSSQEDQDLLRKIVVFYVAIGAKKPEIDYSFLAIKNLRQYEMKAHLAPVLHNGDALEFYDIKKEREVLIPYLEQLLILTDDEKQFLVEFVQKNYRPELLFDATTASRLSTHPMALWKCREQ